MDRAAVFFFPPLVSPSFLHYFAFLFSFRASEFKERNGGFLGWKKKKSGSIGEVKYFSALLFKMDQNYACAFCQLNSSV